MWLAHKMFWLTPIGWSKTGATHIRCVLCCSCEQAFRSYNGHLNWAITILHSKVHDGRLSYLRSIGEAMKLNVTLTGVMYLTDLFARMKRQLMLPATPTWYSLESKLKWLQQISLLERRGSSCFWQRQVFNKSEGTASSQSILLSQILCNSTLVTTMYGENHPITSKVLAISEMSLHLVIESGTGESTMVKQNTSLSANSALCSVSLSSQWSPR